MENILIDPEVIREVLKFNGESPQLGSADAVQSALLETARTLKSRFTSEWATYRLHYAFSTPSPGSPQDEESYLARVRSRREKLNEAYDDDRAQSVYQEASAEVEKCLSDGTWAVRLPGKEILRHFRITYIKDLTDDLFKQHIVSQRIKQEKAPLEIERLCEFIKTR